MAEGKLVRLPVDCYETVKEKAARERREIGATVALLVALGLEAEADGADRVGRR